MTRTTNEDAQASTPLYPISVLATMLDVHQRTLRIYDEEGILVPQRSMKNRRMYSKNDIVKGKFIQYLTRNLGINLMGVKALASILPLVTPKVEDWFVIAEDIAEKWGIDTEKTETRLRARGRKATVNV